MTAMEHHESMLFFERRALEQAQSWQRREAARAVVKERLRIMRSIGTATGKEERRGKTPVEFLTSIGAL